MGWNSWDCYGTTVTEEEVLANAAFMAEHLLPFGWDTVVVDIQWYEPAARAGGYNDGAVLELDGFGRQLPAVNRFPSAAGGPGFKPLADQIHGMGLKFGLHIMRGIPRQAVRDRLPVEGTDSTRTRSPTRPRPAIGTPTTTASTTATRAPRPTTTRSCGCSPNGAWTSSRPTTCWGPTSPRRLPLTGGPFRAAAGTWCSAFAGPGAVPGPPGTPPQQRPDVARF